MEILQDIFHRYLFAIPIAVGVLCEITKIAIDGVRTGAWHERLFRPGGFPSAHSAFVTSLLIVVWRKIGPESTEFAIAVVLACIVWYDAMSSRRAIGEQAAILNRLQHWQHLTERFGHSILEICGGIAFGAAVTAVGIWMS